jgi:outer membrane protein assembly factor BamB
VFRIATLVVTTLAAIPSHAADSPQFRGPNRDGIYADTGLLKSWPADGPTLLWKCPDRGLGHSTVSVSKGRVYGMGLRGEDEVVWAVDEKTGKEAWAVKIAPETHLGGPQGGYGPRAVPTIDGDKLYTEGVGGEFVCMNTANGKIVWHHSLVNEFGGSVPQWGYCESPLVDGDKVIATPGGRTTMLAFNKRTGDVVWKSEIGDPAQYASPLAIEVGGIRQYVNFLGNGVVGVDSKSGRLLWRYDHPANHVANCSMPLFYDNCVYAASQYQAAGGGLVKLTPNATGIDASEVYFNHDMSNHHGGVVRVGDYIYGSSDSSRSLACLEWKTGNVVWSEKSVGKGSVVAADGCLYHRNERSGVVSLVQATPTGFKLLSQFQQPERSQDAAWPYLVIANGKMYVRDMNNLFCYDIKGK